MYPSCKKGVLMTALRWVVSFSLAFSVRQMAVAAGETDQFIPINERMTGKPPQRRPRAKFLLEIMGPEHFSILCAQEKEIAFGAEGIDFTAADLRCNSRAGWITDRIGTVVFMFPERFAIRFIQADHTFDTLNF